MAYSHSQVFLAEIVGTFVFLVIGNGSLCNALLPGTKGHGFGYLGIAVGFGLAVFTALQIVGHISGFFNPAIALGGAVIGLISWQRFLVIVAADLIGAFLASMVVYVIYLPHFQPLALLGDWEDEDELKGKFGSNQAVAVIKQELKGSAKRYVSHGNKRWHSGIKLRHDNERWHIFSAFLDGCAGLLRDEEAVKTPTRGLSSSNLQKVQVERPANVKPTIESIIEADQEIKLVVFCTRPSSEKYYWLFATLSEFLGTVFLAYGAFTFGDRVDAMIDTLAERQLFFNAIDSLLIGILLVGIILSCGGNTGPALNPIKDFPPRVVHWLMPIPGKGSSEWWYCWVPIVGPCAGGVVGALFSQQMKKLTLAQS